MNIFECIDACVIWLEKCINHKGIAKITLLEGVNIGNLLLFFFFTVHIHIHKCKLVQAFCRFVFIQLCGTDQCAESLRWVSTGDARGVNSDLHHLFHVGR